MKLFRSFVVVHPKKYFYVYTLSFIIKTDFCVQRNKEKDKAIK